MLSNVAPKNEFAVAVLVEHVPPSPGAPPQSANRRAPSRRAPSWRTPWWRLVPLAIVIAIALVAVSTGWYRQLSLEALIRHRAAIDIFVSAHRVAALAAFAALYATAVALSIPGAALLTVAGGVIFGVIAGALAAIL